MITITKMKLVKVSELVSSNKIALNGCSDAQEPPRIPLICMKDILVAYQNVIALADINLDIFEGEVLGICGPNASGKSTLLKTILGLIKPIRGSVKFFDCGCEEIPSPLREDVKIGYVPQIHNIDRNFPALVKDVVAMGRIKQVGFFRRVQNDDPLVESALRSVGIWNFRNRPIGHLSGGQQQKVMIARALSSEPEIILLDEPTAALDFKVQKSIMDLVSRLHSDHGLTILLVTHNMNYLKDYTTRVVCLNKQVIWKGLPSDPMLETVINRIFFQ